GRSSADAARTDLFEKVFIGIYDDDGTVNFFDVEEAPPRNQPPANTLSLAELVEVMRRQVMVRNEGVAADERYGPDDPAWSPPAGALPGGLEEEQALEFEDTLSDDDHEDET